MRSVMIEHIIYKVLHNYITCSTHAAKFISQGII